ncbi:hypothetical protein X965_01765 [Morganella sp. EGD-HP17]|nr:hypothetical protein X965_01765 [Morganella sp. EGD-HP17]
MRIILYNYKKAPFSAALFLFPADKRRVSAML